MAEVETAETVKLLDARRHPQEQHFQSDHIYLVAYLICCGQKIIGTSRSGGRTAFLFEKTPELSADVAAFMANAAVPARQFCFELLKLKRTLNTGIQ